MVDAGAGGVIHIIESSKKGALGTYCEVNIGRDGLAPLLAYETAMCLGQRCPGALGEGLRRILYRGLFKSFGKRVRIGKNVIIRHPGQIELGDDVVIHDHSVLTVRGRTSRIVIEDGVHIGEKTVLSCAGGVLHLEDHVHLGRRCRLSSLQGIHVSRETLIHDDVCLTGAGHAYDRRDIPIIKQEVTCKGPIVIGPWTEIGHRATVLDGVSLGKGCNLLDEAMVHSNWGEGVCLAGTPARKQEDPS
jgi:acetyltransferase-like isoleucine patch superfamily enzyme